MREIKFREWETERKTMVVGEREDYDDSVGFRFAHEEGGRRILMQYVGIKDKNGVEIYEGDIVEAYSQGVKGTFEVKWRQDGSPSWILFPAWQSSQMWHLYAVETEKGKYQDSVTVIGNRYENPELLKEEQTC